MALHDENEEKVQSGKQLLLRLTAVIVGFIALLIILKFLIE